MTKKQPLNKDDLKLFNDCPRCFHLVYKHNIERPNTKKKNTEPVLLNEDEIKIIKKTLFKGLPLPSVKCSYCIYRQLVRESGIENELTA
jgi:DNA-directed RNA polymerase subunit RPC12/RpoP